MKIVFLIVVLFVTSICQADDKKLTENKAWHQLLGEWKVVSVEENGKKSKNHYLTGLKFESNKYWIYEFVKSKGNFASEHKRWKIYVDTSPVQFDNLSKYTTRPKTGMNAKSVILGEIGIFEIKGNTLRICQVHNKQNRPTKFKTSKGDGRVLFVLKRVVSTNKDAE